MKTYKPIMALAACTMLCGAAIAVRAIPQDGDDRGSVDVGGVHILTVRFRAGGLSIHDRAGVITARLTDILSRPDLRPSDIHAEPVGDNEAKITVHHKLLVTIDSETAHFNNTDAMGLARDWVENLRHVLPRLNHKRNENDHDDHGHDNPDRHDDSGDGGKK